MQHLSTTQRSDDGSVTLVAFAPRAAGASGAHGSIPNVESALPMLAA